MHVDQMQKLALAVAMLVTAVGVATAQTAQVEQGEKVFAAQKCSICHSIAGKGNLKGSLDGVGSKLSADEIREWIVNAPQMAAKLKAERKPAMRAFTSLSKDDLDALVAYVHSLKR